VSPGRRPVGAGELVVEWVAVRPGAVAERWDAEPDPAVLISRVISK